MNQIKNVEEEFANWLQESMPSSYKQYLGSSISEIRRRLKEINNFFPEQDIFLIENDNPREVINFLKNKIYKERAANNPVFDQYDTSHGSGIPKAVIGKDNYFKFLKQHFDSDSNYWIFQGNPKVYDITNAILEGHLRSYTVTAHKHRIKPGDKAIIWQTGEEAGCYALAEVVGEVGAFKEDPEETQHYKSPFDNKGILKVRINVTDKTAANPILWSAIKDLEEFSDFKGGYQGTNFSATKEQYDSLQKMIRNNKFPKLDGEEWLLEIISSHSKQDLINYFEFLDGILEHFTIQYDDARIVTGTTKNQLNLTIGQRYCWNLYPPTRKKVRFGLISTEKSNSNSYVFGGNEKQAFHNRFNDYSFALDNKSKAIEAIEYELIRSTKSSFTKYNNEALREAVFNKNYRNHLLENSIFGLTPPDIMNTPDTKPPLNQILYGPPGTGKTYEMQAKYFDKFTIKESSLSRQQFLLNNIADKTWWQVLSMAVLDLGNTSVDNIMNHELVKTKVALGDSKLPRNTIWGTLQTHTLTECPHVGVKDRSSIQLFWKDENSHWKIIRENLDEQYPDAISILESIKHYKPDSDTLIKNYEFVTFHQSFSYEDFIEGIKPTMEEEESELAYEIADGVFKKLALRAKADPDNDYALFIDEINRGNVSAIFGELITLIEEDKRSNGENPLSIKLPYSKNEFQVPSNLYISGTMNTADRSIEALDTALRRRFSFKEVMPKPYLLEDIQFNGFTLKEVLETINERIEFLLDRDHTIGHSYFMKLESDDIKGLEAAFENKIIPLLQEYFYHDYEKIALILGPGFVEVKSNHEVKFPDLKGVDKPDTITQFKLKKIGVTEGVTEGEDVEIQSVDIEGAILQLLARDAQ